MPQLFLRNSFGWMFSDGKLSNDYNLINLKGTFIKMNRKYF